MENDLNVVREEPHKIMNVVLGTQQQGSRNLGVEQYVNQKKGKVSETRNRFTGRQERKFQSCKFCKRQGHTEDQCWAKQGRCFRCGGYNHQAKYCQHENARGQNLRTWNPRKSEAGTQTLNG